MRSLVFGMYRSPHLSLQLSMEMGIYTVEIGIYTMLKKIRHAFSTLTLFGPKYLHSVHKQRLLLMMLLIPPE